MGLTESYPTIATQKSSKTDWDFGLLLNTAAGTSVTKNVGVTKTLWIREGNSNHSIIYTNKETVVEIRLYSTEDENEAYRIGQKRCKGTILDINRVDEVSDNGFIITMDSSETQNANVYDIELDSYYLESIEAKSIWFYMYRTSTSRDPTSRAKISVDDWLSSKVFINKDFRVETEDPDDPWFTFNEGDYVEIKYVTAVTYSTEVRYKIENVTLGTVKGRINAIYPVTIDVIEQENENNELGHVRPSDFQAAGASLKETVTINEYEFELDTSAFHEYKYFSVQSYLIDSVTAISPPFKADIGDKIVDENLRAVIREILELGDDEPISEELARTVDTIDCSHRQITTLEGLDTYFVNLVYLDCSHNYLTAIDISKFGALQHLNCSYNDIRGIKFEQQFSLEYADCRYNNIVSVNEIALGSNVMKVDGRDTMRPVELIIDVNVLYRPQKIYLKSEEVGFDDTLYNYMLEELGYPHTYDKLSTVDCEQFVRIEIDGHKYRYDSSSKGNEGFSTDLTQAEVEELRDSKEVKKKIQHLNGIEFFVNLEELIIPYHEIRLLDISKNVKLRRVDVSHNELEYNKNIIDNSTRQVKKIDLSKLTVLEYFDCSYNRIQNRSYIIHPPKVQDGFNENNEPNMVDSIATFIFDPQIRDLTSEIKDENFKSFIREILNLRYSDMILSDELVGITQLNISNRQIRSLAGIEYFVDLEVLFCNDNLIADETITFYRDTTKNTDPDKEYERFDDDGKPIGICPKLYYIDCHNNKIKNLKFYDLDALTYIDCSQNELTTLEVQDCILLEQVNCSVNNLSSLSIYRKDNPNGKYENFLYLDCYENKLRSLSLSLFPNILKLDCHKNQLSSIDLNDYCNGYTSLMESEWVPKLTEVDCSHNLLTTLRVNKCVYLSNLFVTNNLLTELDVGLCRSLGLVDVRYNYIRDRSYVTNAANTVVNYDPQMIDITNIFDGNLLPIIRNLLGLSSSDRVWNYDCLSITELRIENKSISHLNGIEYLTNLEQLYCYDNRLISMDLSHNPNLDVIHCYNNNIANINLEGVTKVREFLCYNNKLESIDIRSMELLELLDIHDNNLLELDISMCKELYQLDCSNNKLRALSIANCESLAYLNCSNNEILSLDVSNNIYLVEIYCNDNLIQSFDPKGRIMLTKLNCSNNLLTELCVISCLALEYLDCSFNILTELDLTGRDVLKYVACIGNAMPNASRVTGRNATIERVDGETFKFSPQRVEVTNEFEDPIFLQEIRDILGLGPEDPVTYSDCASIIRLDVSSKEITTLKGIECLVNLEELDCHDNLIWNLDLSNNHVLTKLYCTYNYMVTIERDIRRKENMLLEENIDFYPQNLIITDYFIDETFRAYIREVLGISEDKPILDQRCLEITEVDVSGMDIHYLNGIEWLPNLKKLNCSYNLLEWIDVSHNTLLEEIDCSYNHIPSIDLTNCIEMRILYCSHNNMTKTVEEDEEGNINTTYDNIKFPKETVIEKDEEGNETKREETVKLYTLEFDDQNILIYDDFTDIFFRNKIISMNDFVTQEVLTDYSVSRITELQLSGENKDEDFKYKNLLGINWFVNLEILNCSYNLIEQLDVTGCVSLRKLDCSHNYLYDEFLKIHNHTDKCTKLSTNDECTCVLEELDCSYNYLKVITVSYFRNLIKFNCSNNNSQLVTLNIKYCPALTNLNCSNNQLITLDCDGDISLIELHCDHNKLTRLTINDCVALEELYCYNNNLKSIDISNNLILVFYHCYYNNITGTINVTNHQYMEQLWCYNNQIESLEIKGNETLKTIYTHHNNLLGLDLEGCKGIEFLNCSYNSIRYITLVTNRPDTLIENENFIYDPQNSY